MTPARARCMLACAGVICAAALAAFGTRLGSVSREHDAALASHARAAWLTLELTALRSQSPDPRADGLADRVRTHVRDASDARARPESIAPLGPAQRLFPGVELRRVRVVASELRLSEVGSLLARLREHEPAWTIASVEISALAGNERPLGGPAPLRLSMLLEALVSTEDPR